MEACICSQLRDIDEYKYIALVEITGVMKSDLYTPPVYEESTLPAHLVPPPPPPPRRFYEVKVKALDKYKGKDQDFIIIQGGNRKYNVGVTSCDLNVAIGQKWLVFGYEFKGRIASGYCTHSKIYENEKGEIDYQYRRGLSLIDMLNEKYNREISNKQDGYLKVRYKNGKTKLEECYENQKRQDRRIAYYNNGQKMLEEYYVDDLLDGSVKWYNTDGSISREAQYKSGFKVCEEYHYSIIGKLRSIKFYDDSGAFIGIEKYKER